MTRLTLLSCIVLSGLTLPVAADDAPAKTTEVKLRALTLQVPETWKQTPSKSSMRLATFEIPAASRDAGAGELAVFNFGGGGGSVNANISRWVGQFDSKGRESEVTVGEAGDQEYHVLEVSGTYNQSVGPPIRRQTKAMPDSRMLAVILQLDAGVYFLKLTGPDETVKAQAVALRESFGGDIKSEKKQGE